MAGVGTPSPGRSCPGPTREGPDGPTVRCESAPPASGRYGGEFAAGLVGACWLNAVGAPAPTDPGELVRVGLADVDDDTPVAAEPLRPAGPENP